MPRQIREILASVRETGDRGRNTGAPGKYGRSGNPRLQCMPNFHCIHLTIDSNFARNIEMNMAIHCGNVEYTFRQTQLPCM